MRLRGKLDGDRIHGKVRHGGLETTQVLTPRIVGRPAGSDRRLLSGSVGRGAGLALAGVLAGQLLLPRVVRGRLSAAAGVSDDPTVWLGAYQTGKLLQWSLIEGPALFLGITYWQTGNQVAILGAVAWWAYLAYVRPGVAELARLIEKDPSRVESALRSGDDNRTR